MKKIVTILLICLFFLTSCGKNDKASPKPEASFSTRSSRSVSKRTSREISELIVASVPVIKIDVDAIDKELLAEFIRDYAFAPESKTIISSDREFIDATIANFPVEWVLAGKNIPEQDVHDALKRIYGIEDVHYPDAYGWSDGLSEPPGYASQGYKDGIYRYWPDDGVSYENIVTVNSLSDNGDITFTVLAEVRFGALEFDDSYEDFKVSYPELRIVLRPFDDSFQFVSLNGNPMPKELFSDSPQFADPTVVMQQRQHVSDVEKEVSRIRELWTTDRNAISAGEYHKNLVEQGVTEFWTGSELKMIEVVSGTRGIEYSRIYAYENGMLIFAFWESQDSHRFYFMNGYLFRWRYTAADGSYIDYDNAYNNADFLAHEQVVMEEAKRLYLQDTKGNETALKSVPSTNNDENLYLAQIEEFRREIIADEWQWLSWGDSGNSLDKYNYAFYDIDGNGVKEFIKAWEDQIIEIGTMVNNQYISFGIWGYRSWCSLGGNGIVCDGGSNSAVSSGRSYYRISTDGKSLQEITSAERDYTREEGKLWKVVDERGNVNYYNEEMFESEANLPVTVDVILEWYTMGKVS